MRDFAKAIASPTATMQIRERAIVNTPVVARVALVTGTLEATNLEGWCARWFEAVPSTRRSCWKPRKRSFAVLAFQDETRVTMRPNTQFQVEEFSPEPYAEAEERGGPSCLDSFSP